MSAAKPMQYTVLALSLSYLGHGRYEGSSTVQFHSVVHAETDGRRLKALTHLFLAFKSVVAFNPAAVAPFSLQHRALSRLCSTVLGCSSQPKMGKRLDVALVDRGLCCSRVRAKSAIKAGFVSVNGITVQKASLSIAEDESISVSKDAESMFVSRAGEKLQAALETFGISVKGAHLLDVGASTGGFTDCALESGAASVCCVDVGHGQLHPKLQADPRVTSFEGMNARALTANDLPRASFDHIVVDVSFISLRLVLPAIWPLLVQNKPGARLVALVKPQFEAGREVLSRGKGFVKDRATRLKTLAELVRFAESELPHCTVAGTMKSPIPGGDGQREFLMALADSSEEVRGPFLQPAFISTSEEKAS